jgi:CheY-like chemotaxis protein
MTVLVVEDDSNVLAEHGGKADVLLVDIVLPGSNGLDFARAAKERSPAVLRSGLGPVLRKPFTSEELLKTLDSL